MSHNRFSSRSKALLLALALICVGLLWSNSTAPTTAHSDQAQADAPRNDTATPTATATATHTPTATPTPTLTPTVTATLKPSLRSVFLPFVREEDTWQKIGAVPGVTLFYEVAVCGRFALAGGNNGLYAANEMGGPATTWTREDDIGGGTDQVVSGVTFVPNSDCQKAYAASRATGVWYGSRTGNNWTWTSVTPVSLGLNGAYVVLVNGDKLYVGGSFGIAQASPLPEPTNTPTWLKASNITVTTFGLSVSARNPAIVHAAVFNRGVFEQSLSDERQWNALPGPTIPNALVYDAAANANGTIVVGYDLGLLRWSQSAWTTPITPSSSTGYTVLAVGPRFYAAQEGQRVLLSLDDGQSWEQVGNGLPTDAAFFVRGLSLSNDGRLFAATSDGIWVWSQTP